MGGSGKWLKSIFTPKKPQTHEEEIHGCGRGRRKWGLWRSSSGNYGHPMNKGFKGGRYSVSDMSESSSIVVGHDAYAAVMAAIIRANPRDFMAIRQEWAAVRIQTVFRGFLARQALRALKAVVRIQAIFRGRLIRKQADVTLKCMQALVRVQAHVRARNVMSPSEDKSMHSTLANSANHFEQGWCDSPGTGKIGGKRLQSRQKVDIKRERAIASNYSQLQFHSNPCSNLRTNKPLSSLNHNKLERSYSGWSWIDGWMPEKPWEENRLMKENHIDPSNATPTFSAKNRDFRSNSSKSESFEVRKNNATTTISVKPPLCRPSQFSRCSSDDSGSTLLYKDGSSSTSSSPVSSKPSYMNLTESTKAKQRVSMSNALPRYSEEGSQFLNKSMTVGIAGSEPYSVNLYDDLYPIRAPVDRYQCSERCGY